MADYLLTKGDGLATRNGGLVVGQCPACCGGGGVCCGTPITFTSVPHKCTWPAGGPISINATLAGTYFYEDRDIAGNSGQPPILRNETINLVLGYLSPPAQAPSNPCSFSTNTVTNGSVLNSNRKELRVTWGGTQSLLGPASNNRNYGNVAAALPGISTFGSVPGVHTVQASFPAAAVFLNFSGAIQDNVVPGTPQWVATVSMAQEAGGGTYVYTHNSPAISPTYSSGGCFTGMSGSWAGGWTWTRTVPGATRRTIVNISTSFTMTPNSIGCSGSGGGFGDGSPDLSDVHDAMMRGAYGKPCQGCG
jgi:hypothetical protein